VVPVSGATFDEGALRIPVTADVVKSAPPMVGDHLAPADEEMLRRHYGLTEGIPADTGVADTESAVATGPRHAAGTQDDDTIAVPPSDGAMTRSEEQLRVGTERVATTRARLVKYVVTEDVQITVPIRREEIRVEQVPVDAEDGDWAGESLEVPAGTPAAATTASGGLPDEIILHTERPVVTVEVVPVERVRLRTELVQGQETVTEQVQREQIAVDRHAVPDVGSR
jgi:stress response protein YsnF